MRDLYSSRDYSLSTLFRSFCHTLHGASSLSQIQAALTLSCLRPPFLLTYANANGYARSEMWLPTSNSAPYGDHAYPYLSGQK